MDENLNEMIKKYSPSFRIVQPPKANKSEITKAKAVFGKKEWAPYSENCVVGCAHDCRYCYAKADAIRHKRTRPQQWKNEVVRTEMLQKEFRKRNGRIMFPSSHDIAPIHLSECLTFLKNILNPGNEVLIVTKPHLECVKAIGEDFSWSKEKILFRFTIGSSNSNTLKFWEPNAPDFAERLESLKYACDQGFQTSVSCEPMLDIHVGDVIQQVSPFVTDTIWLGLANLLPSRLRLNAETAEATRAMAAQLMKEQSKEFIWVLYSQYKDNPQIRWKESIKKIIGFDK